MASKVAGDESHIPTTRRPVRCSSRTGLVLVPASAPTEKGLFMPDRHTTLQRSILIAVLVGFGGFTIVAIAEHGVIGFVEEAVRNTATLQVLIDLSIVAILALVWMYRDSRDSGVPFVPYALLTIAAGSFGPLGYLLHRTWRAPRSAQ